MSFNVNWDIYKESHESDDHWLLRRNFMESLKWNYPEEKLVCLSHVYANITFKGYIYPREVMEEVGRMSNEVFMNLTYIKSLAVGTSSYQSYSGDGSWRRYHSVGTDTKVQASTSKAGFSSTNNKEKTLQDHPSHSLGNTSKITQQASLRVCIKDANKAISPEHSVMLQNDIMKSISRYDEGIRFIHFSTVAGCFIVTCANERSRDWLDKQILTLEPWHGAQLTIINESDLTTAATSISRLWIPNDNLDPNSFLEQWMNPKYTFEQDLNQTKSTQMATFSSSPIEETCSPRLMAFPEPASVMPCKADEQPEGCRSIVAAPATVPSSGMLVKLNGAARKRFRRLIAGNIGADEARELAVKPWKQISIQNLPPDPKPRSRKRQRSEEESPEEQLKKVPRLDAQGVRPIKQVVDGMRVCIRSVTSMSDDQMKKVHQSLTSAILKTADNGKGPKFWSFTRKPGWILVSCVNQESLRWLEREVPKIRPWAEAELSIIPESKLPKPMVAVTFIPSRSLFPIESLDEAIHLLRIQNKGLNTGLWKVLHSKSEENGYVVTFSLDELSVEALAAVDFQANWGFKKVNFKVRPAYSESKTSAVVKPDSQPSASSSHSRPPRQDERVPREWE